MTGSYVAELIKLRKRSTSWVLFGAGAVLSLTFGYVIPYLGYTSGDDNMQTAGIPREQVLADMLPGGLVGNAIGGYPVFAGALALVLGALVVGSEYGWGTVKTVLTQGPRRFTLLAAQFAALVSALALWVLGNFALSAAASTAVAMAEDRSLNWPGFTELTEGFGAGLLVLTMWALLGAVLALLLRGVALPIGLGVASPAACCPTWRSSQTCCPASTPARWCTPSWAARPVIRRPACPTPWAGRVRCSPWPGTSPSARSSPR